MKEEFKKTEEITEEPSEEWVPIPKETVNKIRVEVNATIRDDLIALKKLRAESIRDAKNSVPLGF